MADEAKRDEATAGVDDGRPGLAAKLTDRDRDLLGMLVLSRSLSAVQVHRLAFDGKNLSVAYRRLAKLACAAGGQPAFLGQRFFRTYDGDRVGIWAPTLHAMPAAVARAGPLPELPKHGVGAQFLEHLIRLNDVFVDLWRVGSGCPKAVHPALRWVPSDRVRLLYGEWEMRQGRQQQRVIQPDAVLELPLQRRRFFLECELGTHVIAPRTDGSPGATLNKADRYHTFLTGTGVDAKQTHYASQYADGYLPELLFLVQTDGRAASVNAALGKWRKGLGGGAQPSMRAATFEAATAELRKLAGLPELAALPKPPGRPPPAPKVTAARSREVTSTEVRVLRDYVADSVVALKRARHVFRELARADLPRYPASYELVQLLLGRLVKKNSG